LKVPQPKAPQAKAEGKEGNLKPDGGQKSSPAITAMVVEVVTPGGTVMDDLVRVELLFAKHGIDGLGTKSNKKMKKKVYTTFTKLQKARQRLLETISTFTQVACESKDEASLPLQ
jgi:hypothetical protein